jgi:hypothetical protein
MIMSNNQDLFIAAFKATFNDKLSKGFSGVKFEAAATFISTAARGTIFIPVFGPFIALGLASLVPLVGLAAKYSEHSTRKGNAAQLQKIIG